MILCKIKVLPPSRQRQRCLRIDGNNTIATRGTMPAQQRQGACASMTLANLANLCCGQAPNKGLALQLVKLDMG
jgi:hypothetical protein